MVPAGTGDIGGSTANSSEVGRSSELTKRTTPPSHSGALDTSHMAYIRGSLSDQGFSEAVATVICASWRNGTEKSYNTAWRRWVRWCGARKVNPVSASLVSITEFLLDLFREGKEYSTVNSYRSAISVSHPDIDGMAIGKHPVITRFMQGIYNSRPSQPRYKFVWDVRIVVRHIKAMLPSEKLPLKELSWKLVTLLAITNADRASDLKLLDLNFRVFTSEGVRFEVAGLSKTCRSGPPREVVYGRFASSPSIRPVSTLQEYEKKTSHMRCQSGDSKPLFISYCKPHKPVSSATIARWVKSMLAAAGIDITQFKAHSTRAASTSAARRLGVSTADILRSANWSRESTFERFYWREIEHPFTQAVLKGNYMFAFFYIFEHTLVMYTVFPRHRIGCLTRVLGT